VMRAPFALLVFVALAGCSTSSVGLFRGSDGSLVELHVGHDQQLRGYMRAGDRIAALSSVTRNGSTVRASAVYEDGSRTEITKDVRLVAAEKPAGDAVRREIEEAYRQLARAVETKDFDAFQALRVPEFATIPPDGVPSPASRMADRARGLLGRIQPPITNTNEILQLTTRGDEAIATVRQKFTRRIQAENEMQDVHTEVTQRESWRRTADGWRLVFVDEVRDPVRIVNGQRVQ